MTTKKKATKKSEQTKAASKKKTPAKKKPQPRSQQSVKKGVVPPELQGQQQSGLSYQMPGQGPQESPAKG